MSKKPTIFTRIVAVLLIVLGIGFLNAIGRLINPAIMGQPIWMAFINGFLLGLGGVSLAVMLVVVMAYLIDAVLFVGAALCVLTYDGAVYLADSIIKSIKSLRE